MWEEAPGRYFNQGEGDDGVEGAILQGEGCVVELAAQEGNGIGHEEIGYPEPVVALEFFVETCGLQRDVEEGWIAESERPPRDEEGVRVWVEVEGVVLEGDFVEETVHEPLDVGST